MNPQETYRGIVHGSTIELSQSPGVPDGMEVEVVIKRRSPTASERAAKLLSLFGSCKEDAADLDAYIAWSHEQRRDDRRGFVE